MGVAAGAELMGVAGGAELMGVAGGAELMGVRVKGRGGGVRVKGRGDNDSDSSSSSDDDVDDSASSSYLSSDSDSTLPERPKSRGGRRRKKGEYIHMSKFQIMRQNERDLPGWVHKKPGELTEVQKRTKRILIDLKKAEANGDKHEVGYVRPRAFKGNQHKPTNVLYVGPVHKPVGIIPREGGVERVTKIPRNQVELMAGVGVDLEGVIEELFTATETIVVTEIRDEMDNMERVVVMCKHKNGEVRTPESISRELEVATWRYLRTWIEILNENLDRREFGRVICSNKMDVEFSRKWSLTSKAVAAAAQAKEDNMKEGGGGRGKRKSPKGAGYSSLLALVCEARAKGTFDGEEEEVGDEQVGEIGEGGRKGGGEVINRSLLGELGVATETGGGSQGDISYEEADEIADNLDTGHLDYGGLNKREKEEKRDRYIERKRRELYEEIDQRRAVAKKKRFGDALERMKVDRLTYVDRAMLFSYANSEGSERSAYITLKGESQKTGKRGRKKGGGKARMEWIEGIDERDKKLQIMHFANVVKGVERDEIGLRTNPIWTGMEESTTEVMEEIEGLRNEVRGRRNELDLKTRELDGVRGRLEGVTRLGKEIREVLGLYKNTVEVRRVQDKRKRLNEGEIQGGRKGGTTISEGRKGKRVSPTGGEGSRGKIIGGREFATGGGTLGGIGGG
ncbi:hypothetical protein TrCOL_g967 [Triparma columacea]|uniref:Uncharacterized protein n=1 Tax=Triparma columacea TaxID=722753 RepID=A0A9W7G7Y8_9STRA|nr:hypothetical protein TrCOL_g967 [Triparma columacea]